MWEPQATRMLCLGMLEPTATPEQERHVLIKGAHKYVGMTWHSAYGMWGAYAALMSPCICTAYDDQSALLTCLPLKRIYAFTLHLKIMMTCTLPASNCTRTNKPRMHTLLSGVARGSNIHVVTSIIPHHRFSSKHGHLLKPLAAPVTL